LIEPPFTGVDPNYAADLGAPISRWAQVASFDAAHDCEMARRMRIEASENSETNGGDRVVPAVGRYAQCIATNDPRLKGK
jgi:hypothetical protein